MGTIKWMRPSGTEITTNDSEKTIECCLAMEWEPLDEQPDEVGDPAAIESPVANPEPMDNGETVKRRERPRKKKVV